MLDANGVCPTLATRIAAAPFHDEGYGYDVFGLSRSRLASVLDRTAPIYDRYFRVDSKGAEVIPARGPAILIANHGGVLPVDAALLCADVIRHAPAPRILRPVTDHFVVQLPWVSSWFARVGVVNGTRANVSSLLERGELIAIWPEGTSGPAKRFAERYQLQGWNPGFAELAIRYRAPVIPVAIIGSEESWPLLGKLHARVFGAPYIPIPAVPAPLPVHYHIRYCSPVRLEHEPRDAEDPDVVRAAATRARDALVHAIDHARMERRGLFR